MTEVNTHKWGSNLMMEQPTNNWVGVLGNEQAGQLCIRFKLNRNKAREWSVYVMAPNVACREGDHPADEHEGDSVLVLGVYGQNYKKPIHEWKVDGPWVQDLLTLIKTRTGGREKEKSESWEAKRARTSEILESYKPREEEGEKC